MDSAEQNSKKARKKMQEYTNFYEIELENYDYFPVEDRSQRSLYNLNNEASVKKGIVLRDQRRVKFQQQRKDLSMASPASKYLNLNSSSDRLQKHGRRQNIQSVLNFKDSEGLDGPKPIKKLKTGGEEGGGVSGDESAKNQVLIQLKFKNEPESDKEAKENSQLTRYKFINGKISNLV